MAAKKKPSKPTPNFPLFAHRNGQWAKAIGQRGKQKTYYFGPWDDPDGALTKYHEFMAKQGEHEALQAAKPQKPKKPYKDYPLFAHQNGQWAKTLNRRTYYFGKWDDPEGALRNWLTQKTALLAGNLPQVLEASGCTLNHICTAFLASKAAKVAVGELSEPTYKTYKRECDRLLKFFGGDQIAQQLTPFDFENYRNALCGLNPKSAQRSPVKRPLGPTALTNAIMATRIVFKYAFDQDLLAKPMKYGQGFNRPSPKVMRTVRNTKPKRLFEPEEIRSLINSAGGSVKAMILLGINCGLGNTDCAMLPESAVNLKRQWLDYPRPKTGVIRWAPLWDETCEAIRESMKKRREPKFERDRGLLFLTQKLGIPWRNVNGYDPISNEISKLLKKAGIDRQGLGFYALRHTFQTIAEGCRDQKAVEFIMGHAPDSKDMSARYREEFKEPRLRDVTDYVHSWLFVSGNPIEVPDHAEPGQQRDSIAAA